MYLHINEWFDFSGNLLMITFFTSRVTRNFSLRLSLFTVFSTSSVTYMRTRRHQSQDLFLFRLRLSVSMWLYSSLPTNFSIIAYIASCLNNVKLGRRVNGHKTTKLFAYSLYTVFHCFPILSLSVSDNLL